MVSRHQFSLLRLPHMHAWCTVVKHVQTKHIKPTNMLTSSQIILR